MPALQISIAPNTALETSARPVFIDVVYSRTIEGKASDGVADLPNVVQETLRFVFDDQLRGSFQLADVALGSRIDLSFLGGDGTVRLAKSVSAGDGALSVTLTKTDVAVITAEDPQPQEPRPRVQRRAYFVPTSDTRVPFEASTLQVVPVTLSHDGWSKLGLDRLFLSDTPVNSSVQWPAQGWPQSGSVPWTPTHVSVD